MDSFPLLMLLLSFTYHCPRVSCQGCGSPETIVPKPRIVGGKEMSQGDLPWQVYLNKTIFYEGIALSSFCGASIVSSSYLLTGAHCVFDYNVTEPIYNVTESIYNVTIEAILGSVDLQTNITLRTATQVIVHEKFDIAKKLNDIALVKIHPSLHFDHENRDLAPICLARTFNNTVNCISSGFGYRDGDQKQLEKKLYGIPQHSVDNSKCHAYFEAYNDATNLCVQGSPGEGVCKGDSGGPFQCHNQLDGRWYQMGIVSYGIPCALTDVPDVLTRLDFFYDWITQHIGSDSF